MNTDSAAFIPAQAEDVMQFAEMTEEAYRAHPGVNKSTLWQLRRSPAHYKYAMEHPSPDTPALKFGRAIHMAILQPNDFNRHYILTPNIDRRTKAGKEEWEAFTQQYGDRELLNRDAYDQIVGMYESVWNDPAAAKLLTGCAYETPLFWTDEATDIECKCRLDAHKREGQNGIIIDLKSCTDADTNHFMRDAIAYGYDVQCAHYMRGFRATFDVDGLEWYFIAVEKKPPYAVNVIRAGAAFIDRGTWQLIDLMDKLAECRRKNEWPGYGVNELLLPEWASIPEDVDE